MSLNKENSLDKQLIRVYYNRFLIERVKMRYLQLRTTMTSYALEYCISNYDKIGLTEAEIECIKARTHTFLNYYKDFNLKERDLFPLIYQKPKLSA